MIVRRASSMDRGSTRFLGGVGLGDFGAVDWSTAPIDQLNAAFAGKKIKDVPPEALQRLADHVVKRLGEGPTGVGVYGESILTPVPGQNVRGQVFHFWRRPANERMRDMAALVDPNLWQDPNRTLYLVAINGQKKYGFFQKINLRKIDLKKFGKFVVKNPVAALAVVAAVAVPVIGVAGAGAIAAGGKLIGAATGGKAAQPTAQPAGPSPIEMQRALEAQAADIQAAKMAAAAPAAGAVGPAAGAVIGFLAGGPIGAAAGAAAGYFITKKG